MSDAPKWLGLDVGGANLKAATTGGFAEQIPFPLWQRPTDLPAALAELIASAPPHNHIAATMTGELADCFASKQEGVAAIAHAIVDAAGSTPSWVYNLRSSGFVPTETAAEHIRGVAAGNWHALATACGRLTEQPGLLVDVGSTTTDVVRFGPEGAESSSVTDTDRLVSGELIYQGVGRTPVAAVTPTLPLAGGECPVAAELFATTADAAVLLGLVPKSAEPGADGRPMSREHAAARLARMLCADAADLTAAELNAMASRVVEVLERRLQAAVESVISDHQTASLCIISGAGEWLARRVVERSPQFKEVRSLASIIGDEASVCGPAWAVAYLAETEPPV